MAGTADSSTSQTACMKNDEKVKLSRRGMKLNASTPVCIIKHDW